MTKVVKVNRRTNNYTLYIGREWAGLPGSKWQNPFRIKAGESIGSNLAKYEAYIRSRPELMASLCEIDDQVLGCWCHKNPDEDWLLYICHGDVLIKLRQEQIYGQSKLRS